MENLKTQNSTFIVSRLLVLQSLNQRYHSSRGIGRQHDSSPESVSSTLFLIVSHLFDVFFYAATPVVSRSSSFPYPLSVPDKGLLFNYVIWFAESLANPSSLQRSLLISDHQTSTILLRPLLTKFSLWWLLMMSSRSLIRERQPLHSY